MEDVIRLGTAEDMDAVMKLIMAATEENAFVNPSVPKIATAIWGALTRQIGLIGVAEGPDKDEEKLILKGVTVLLVGETYYSESKVLEEKIVYTHPEWRLQKYGIAKKLCRFAKDAANKLELPLLIGVVSTTRTAGKVAMYKREFGEPAGAFFLYNSPKTGEFSRE